MIAFDETLVAGAPFDRHGLDLLALDQALERLAAIDERKARVVELRCFGGLTIDEVAEVLSVSHATVERDLSLARSWQASDRDRAPAAARSAATERAAVGSR